MDKEREDNLGREIRFGNGDEGMRMVKEEKGEDRSREKGRKKKEEMECEKRR